MGDVRNQLLQVSPFLCDAVFIFLHDLVQPPQPIVDFIEQAFFLNRLLGLYIPGEHIIHLTTKGIGEPNQLPADQSHKEDNAEQYKETEQEHTPDSGYILGQQISSGADCANRQQQKRSPKDAGFVDGEFRYSFRCPSDPHIAHAVHRLDVLAALRFNFVPHPADGRSQGVFIHKVPIGIPQLFKQYLPGQNILRVFGQNFQQPVF